MNDGVECRRVPSERSAPLFPLFAAGWAGSALRASSTIVLGAFCRVALRVRYSTFPVLRDSTVKRQDSSKPTKSAASDERQESWLRTWSLLSFSIVNVRPYNLYWDLKRPQSWARPSFRIRQETRVLGQTSWSLNTGSLLYMYVYGPLIRACLDVCVLLGDRPRLHVRCRHSSCKELSIGGRRKRKRAGVFAHECKKCT